MTSFENGRRAEAVAAEFLQRKGCQIVAQNWRTRHCEIDIIALRGDVVYFCEVKYRRSAQAGTGIDYITPQKVRQMCFAAESWLHIRQWNGAYQLCAIEVSGSAFVITRVEKDITV